MSTPLTYMQALEQIPTWKYSEPRRNQSGSYSVYVNSGDGSRDRIRIQMALDTDQKPSAPFGISEPYNKEQAGNSFRRSFDMTVNEPGLKKFFETLDTNNMDKFKEKCQQWFDKSLPPHLIEARYKSIMSMESQKYTQTFRTKVNTGESDPVQVYLVTKRPDKSECWKKGSITDIQKGVTVVPIVEIVGLWFMAGLVQFGMTLLCTDVLVYPNPVRKEFDFVFSKPIEKAGPGEEEHVPMQETLEPPQSDSFEDVREVTLGDNFEDPDDMQTVQTASPLFKDDQTLQR